MTEQLIAPCGMNCNICYAHLRVKNQCPGCRLFNQSEPVSIARCIIRNCAPIKEGRMKYCYGCGSYPCKRLKNLDKRYRLKYHMSEIQNLETIKAEGIRALLDKETARWTCPDCGGTINVHKQVCSECGREKEQDTSGNPPV